MINNQLAIKLLKRLEQASIQLDDAAGKLADWNDVTAADACAKRAMRCRAAVREGCQALGVEPPLFKIEVLDNKIRTSG